jgi:hypothetical protein
MPEKRDKKMIYLVLSCYGKGGAAYSQANRYSLLISA